MLRALLFANCGARLLMRGEYGIQQLHDRPLFGGGQRLDAFKLLRDLGLWFALAGAALHLRSEQFLLAGIQPLARPV